MNITKDTVVTLSFRASDAQGKLLEDGKTPRSYLHGGYGNTLPGIEKALEGQSAGYETSVTLAPEDVPETGAPERTAEIDLAVRSRRMVGGTWITDFDARRFRLTAPFAAGWDRGWGFLWGT